MRALLAFAFTLLLPPAAAGAQPARSERRYTPRTGWQVPSDARFYESWFGDQLRAMDEPVLAGASDLNRFRTRFRLLVLPSDDSAWVVRIDEPVRGAALLTVVELNRAGPYAPGRVARRLRSQFGFEDLAEVHAALDRLRFDSLPMQEPLPEEPAGECNQQGGCEIVLCVHATHYVLERLDRSGRRFVERSGCGLPRPFGELIGLLRTLREP